MALQYLCTPAFIYFLYSFTQILIDVSSGLFNTALLKFTISIVITTALHHLCIKGFQILSWIIVFIPFIFLTVVTSILLLGMGLDPYKGKLKVYNPDENNYTTNDIREIYTQKYGSRSKAEEKLPSTFNEGVIGVVDKFTPTETTSRENNNAPNGTTKSENAKQNISNNNGVINPDSQINCTYGEYPNCINTKLVADYDSKSTDNKQENNTRILSSVLLKFQNKTPLKEL